MPFRHPWVPDLPSPSLPAQGGEGGAGCGGQLPCWCLPSPSSAARAISTKPRIRPSQGFLGPIVPHPTVLSLAGTAAVLEIDVENSRASQWQVLPHSAPIPNSLMIGHHFSASDFCIAASASGVCFSRGKISNSRAAKQDRTAGSDSASTDAALSLAMMSFGVPLGAKSPLHSE